MNDKARELLERALDLADYIVGQEDLAEEIRAYLAEPEKKQEPLSGEEIESVFNSTFLGVTHFGYFRSGIRFAEKHHGIGGEG